MAHDIFEQLTAADIPPPPDTLDRDVHCRLNRALLGVHLTELFSTVAWFAIGHFARAMLSAVIFTLSGRHMVDRRDRP